MMDKIIKVVIALGGNALEDKSMPKMMASVKFVKNNPERKSIITSLYKSMDALNGLTGTVITSIRIQYDFLMQSNLAAFLLCFK